MVEQENCGDHMPIYNGDQNNNSFDGGNGADEAHGNAGNDSLYGNGGNDVLSGDAGDDSLSGGSGNDMLDGGDGRDSLNGDIGNDIVTGGAGNDILWAYTGEDSISGGDGDDLMFVSTISSGDHIHGGNGVDTLTVSDGGPSIDLSAIDVTDIENLIGPYNSHVSLTLAQLGMLSSIDRVNALTLTTGGSVALDAANFTPHYINLSTAGNSLTISGAYVRSEQYYEIQGGAGDDVVTTGSHEDSVRGGGGNDFLSGGASYNALSGQDGDDTLIGNGGDDFLYGGAGADAAYGGSGNDQFTLLAAGEAAGDHYYGGSGQDTARVIIAASIDLSRAQFEGIEALEVDSLSTAILSLAQAQTFGGINGDGSVSFATGGTADLRGLSGTLRRFVLNDAGNRVDLTGSTGDYIIHGGAGDDIVLGGSGDDEIHGNGGNNVAYGGLGNDLLYASAGIDSLHGGALGDTFIVSSLAELGASDHFDGGESFDQLVLNFVGAVDLSNVAISSIEMLTGDFGVRLTAQQLDGFDSLSGIKNFTITTGGAVDLSQTSFGGFDDYVINLADAGNAVDLARGVGFSFTVNGGDGDDVIIGNIDNVLRGNGGNDTLTGGYGEDALYGGAGNDLLDGAPGVEEWPGDDILDGGSGNDTASYATSTGAVAVSLLLTTAQDTGGAGTDTLTGVENLIGSRFADALHGTKGDNVIEGGAGNDAIDGDAGNDTASYAGAAAGVTVSLAITAVQNTLGAGSDLLVGMENLVGSAFADMLTGNAASNQLSGGAGDDVLDGGAGNDRLDGGGSADTASFASASAGVTASLITGAAGGAGSDTLIAIENLTGSAFADMLTGDTGANILAGGSGDDLLLGGAGNDALVGGAGVDTSSYAGAAKAVTVNLATGLATGGAGSDTLTGIENLVGSALNDILTGDAGANLIDGGAGLGADRLNGGGGIDTVTYANAAARVRVDLSITTAQNTIGAGIDTLVQVEKLIGSAYGDVLTGSSDANALSGGAGNDLLTGGAGVDMLDGGAGDDVLADSSGDGAGIGIVTTFRGGDGFDIASFAGLARGVQIAVAASETVFAVGNEASVALSGIEGLIGTGFDDALDGDGAANSLAGGAGVDRLRGGAGNDLLDGGTGIDTAYYDFAAAAVSVNLAIQSAQNSGGDGVDSIRNVENLFGSSFGDRLTGNQYANSLIGSGGDDVLEGGLGNDQLIGGDGTDTATFATALAAVKVSLAVATAQSTGGAGGDTLSGIENLTGSAFDDMLTGDDGANFLIGNAGNDVLAGGAGNDMLNGGAGIDTANYAGTTGAILLNLALATAQDSGAGGNDVLISIENVIGTSFDDIVTGSSQANAISGSGGNDAIDGGSGNDAIDGGNGNDALKGSAGDDLLTGGAGLDTLTGGVGADMLSGGAGFDIFLFTAITDSTVASADRILDFTSGDRIDLSAIDADSGTGGNQAFHLAASFSRVAGEFTLAFNAGSNITMALFDTDGDATANMAILFTGDVTGLTEGWVL